METYTLLRELADSWVLLALSLFFLGVFVWIWRPSAKAIHADAASMIFRNEKKPEGNPSSSKEA